MMEPAKYPSLKIKGFAVRILSSSIHLSIKDRLENTVQYF